MAISTIEGPTKIAARGQPLRTAKHTVTFTTVHPTVIVVRAPNRDGKFYVGSRLHTPKGRCLFRLHLRKLANTVITEVVIYVCTDFSDLLVDLGVACVALDR